MLFLIIFNLFFGWIFLRPLHWLLFEIGLIVFLLLQSWIFTRRIISRSFGKSKVIDIKGEIIKDEPEKKMREGEFRKKISID